MLSLNLESLSASDRTGVDIFVIAQLYWRCCSPAGSLFHEKRTRKNKCVKEGGATEHTHRLRNRHGPMGAQRCLSQNELLWSAVSTDVISVRSSV